MTDSTSATGNAAAPDLAAWKARRREAVARAICTARAENPDHRDDARGNDFRWQDYLDTADAAISAFLTASAGGPLPAVAWLTTDEEGSPAMLFFDRNEAVGYCDDAEEPIALGYLADTIHINDGGSPR